MDASGRHFGSQSGESSESPNFCLHPSNSQSSTAQKKGVEYFDRLIEIQSSRVLIAGPLRSTNQVSSHRIHLCMSRTCHI